MKIYIAMSEGQSPVRRNFSKAVKASFNKKAIKDFIKERNENKTVRNFYFMDSADILEEG